MEPIGFNDKLAHSIELLRKGESMALRFYPKGYYLAFSGGKDSQALYHLAKMADVKFEPHYAVTTLDPPELVRFIHKYYPDVICDRPDLNFWQLCIKKRALPTMRMRFCCAVLKETKGAGTVTLTGVRRQESSRRAKRKEAETVTGKEKNKFYGTYEQLDQFTRTKENEGISCVNGKDKIVINPIIEWSESDVWYFLNEIVKVPHCELYDQGWKRLGCLFCPMASKKNILTRAKLYPKYKEALLRTIHRLRLNGYMLNYKELTDEEVFEWWISKLDIRKWYFNNKVQQKLKL